MREIEIERLLQWAYVELLKRGTVGTLAQQWNQLRDYGERGWTAIDDDFRAELRMPAGAGEPHPDALTVEHAVHGLRREVAIDWRRERARIMGDLPMLAAHIADPFIIPPSVEPGRKVEVVHAGRLGEVNGSQLRVNAARVDRTVVPPRMRVFSEVGLVEQYARMARRPRWDIGPLVPRRVIGRNYKPVMVGSCEATGRYSPGAYCPLQWADPTLEQLVLCRAEYLLWHDALVTLTGTLRAWTLADHVPVKPAASALPWRDPPPPEKPAPITGVAPAWRTMERPQKDQRRRRAPVPSGG